MLAFWRDNPQKKWPLFDYQKRIDCVLCSFKKVDCECAPKMRVAPVVDGPTSKSQQVKHLFSKSQYNAFSWENLRHMMSTCTPFHFRFYMDSEAAAKFNLHSASSGLPVDFIMRLTVTSAREEIRDLKTRHVQSFLHRSMGPLLGGKISGAKSALVEQLEKRHLNQKVQWTRKTNRHCLPHDTID